MGGINAKKRRELINLYGQESIVDINDTTFGIDISAIMVSQFLHGEEVPGSAINDIMYQSSSSVYSEYAIPDENITIDRLCTASATDSEGNYLYHSNSRAARTGGIRKARNASVRTYTQ